MRATTLAVMFLVAGLGGCTTQETHHCIGDVCLADPTSHDAAYILETYGLHQITADDLRDGVPRIDDSFLIWQTDVPGVVDGDIMGYDFDSKQLLPIATGEEYLQSRAFVAEGRVVLTQEPMAEAPDAGRLPYLVLWDSRTRTSQVLETDLQGKLDSYGFDGSWALFTNRGDLHPDKNGLYVYHVDDGRLIHLYTPYPDDRSPDGGREFVESFTVDAGQVYYTRVRVPDNGTNHYTLYQVNLATQSRQAMYEGPLPIGPFEVEDRWVAVESKGDSIWVMDMQDSPGVFKQVSDKGGRPALGGDWLVFGESSLTTRPAAVAYHLPTGTRHVLATSLEVPGGFREISFDWRDTDGHYAVFTTIRMHTHNLDNIGYDLYYYDLDTLLATPHESK